MHAELRQFLDIYLDYENKIGARNEEKSREMDNFKSCGKIMPKAGLFYLLPKSSCCRRAIRLFNTATGVDYLRTFFGFFMSRNI